MSRLAQIDQMQRGSNNRLSAPLVVLIGTAFVNETLTRVLQTPGPQAITDANAGTEVFTIAGDLTDTFLVGQNIIVAGSTGNDAQYTITAVVENGGDTEITVGEGFADGTADGTIQIIDIVVVMKRTTQPEERIIQDIFDDLVTELNADAASTSEPVISLTVKNEDSTPVDDEVRGIPVNRIYEVFAAADPNDSIVILQYTSDERAEYVTLTVDETVAAIKAAANA